MVIDYRKLNEMGISDELPLPKQEDILQALEGSQWLSALDALAGFTQLEVEPKDREKLWQFVRMPFCYKSGPSELCRTFWLHFYGYFHWFTSTILIYFP